MEAVDANWARRALPGFFSPLEVVASVPTTMSRAADLAAAGEPEGATVVAEEQTEGRGRLGRAWVAPPGTSLLVSVVLRPPLATDAVWLTVAAAGVALAGAVDEVAPGAAPAGLKWPNDLELHGGKAAGLLAEAQLEGDRLAAVLLGMGVNVGQGAGDFPAEVAGRATSVSLAAGPRSTGAGCWPPGPGGSSTATRSSAPAVPARCWPPTANAWSRSAARSGPTASAPPRSSAPPST